MTEPAIDLPYRLRWRARTARGGAHRSTLAGAGGMFRDLTSLLDARDPRRIDLRQSLRDPFDAIHVRRFEQTSAITVTVIVDVSASMLFVGRTRKRRLSQQLLRAFADSALRSGDSFGVIAADSVVHAGLSQPPTRSRSVVNRALDDLAAFPPAQAGSGGLVAAAERLGTRRGLVICVSDFLMPAAQLHSLFRALAGHDVIPIALYDTAEIEALPEWGLLELHDLETGRRRMVALRPSLKAAWRRDIEARREAFRAIARQYGRQPFEITDVIDWHRLGAHLLQGAV